MECDGKHECIVFKLCHDSACHGPLLKRRIGAGHKVELDTAVAVVLACCTHRIPEPIRQADLRSRQHIRTEEATAAAAAADDSPPA